MSQPEFVPKPSDAEDNSEGVIRRIKAWLRSSLRDNHHDIKEALEEVLEEHNEDGHQLPTEEQNMLKNVLGFSELAVKDIMTPRTDIRAVEYNSALSDIKEHIIQNRHTRVPVYNDTLDNIKGFLHIKDLVPMLSGDEPFNMALILRDILIVPPSMKLITLLFKMRISGVHMGIVVDEYGGTDGLVTLEDLFEKIVGDIQDEHDDDEEATLAWDAQRACVVDARIPVKKLEADLALSLAPKEEEAVYDTLGGLITHQLGRVPTRGEIIENPSGARFEILSADPRRIHKVRIYAPPIPPAPEA